MFELLEELTHQIYQSHSKRFSDKFKTLVNSLFKKTSIHPITEVLVEVHAIKENP
jgi:hypothetical protein